MHTHRPRTNIVIPAMTAITAATIMPAFAHATLAPTQATTSAATTAPTGSFRTTPTDDASDIAAGGSRTYKVSAANAGARDAATNTQVRLVHPLDMTVADAGGEWWTRRRSSDPEWFHGHWNTRPGNRRQKANQRHRVCSERPATQAGGLQLRHQSDPGCPEYQGEQRGRQWFAVGLWWWLIGGALLPIVLAALVFLVTRLRKRRTADRESEEVIKGADPGNIQDSTSGAR